MRLAFREILIIILLALGIFLLAQATLQSCQVVGFSMEPNLHGGQRLLLVKAVYWFGDPQRGDVVVFVPPIESDRDFIKRIIALPGETVEIKGGKVYINDELLDEPYIPEGQEPQYDMPPKQVPEGCYFVLGDNRNHSTDSHVWVHQGIWLSQENILGKAWLCYWPLREWHLVPSYSYAIE